MKPTTARQLVANAKYTSYARKTWYDLLAPFNRSYVDDVVFEMKKQGARQPYVVADALIKELKLSACRTTVASTLKRMCNAK